MITWLENWYLSQCDGDWEHDYGIRISTLDNPGWSVSINILDTSIKGKPFEDLSTDRSENDWVHCRLRNEVFEGFGGPKNLEEIIKTFKDWVERS